MIKAIIFDCGGVLILHRTRIVTYILTEMFPQQLELVLPIWQEYRAALNNGSASPQELVSKLKEITHSEKSVDELIRQWEMIYKRESQVINEELLKQIAFFRKKYKVYVFTDTIALHDDVNSKRNIYEQFDHVYKSFRIGKAKLEGENAFLYVAEQIKATPEECIFIDDTEAHVETAKKIDMKAIQYTKNKQLLADLERLGVAIR
jgi:glucose-1-phosphatase